MTECSVITIYTVLGCRTQHFPFLSFFFFLSLFLFSAMGNSSTSVIGSDGEVAKSIFDFSVEDGKGEKFDLSTLRGKKAFLIVNVASE
jgi:cytochrome oxidase Cu insertion factor (SCO1/SenC/PrrC family)